MGKTKEQVIVVIFTIVLMVVGVVVAMVFVNNNESKSVPEPVASSSEVEKSSEPVKKGVCSCFRGGDSVEHYDADGKRKSYDEGFCGRCIDGIVYGCPTSECTEDCSSLLYSGPMCAQCNNNERNIHCIQNIQDVENKKIA